ncbi:beta-chimaerin [Maniola hyperantus]|uniref:beta-chimaerin n=1 Tax=Aphantopus hyperantus TaxID=2795564 RepID=UPI0015689CAB|nr:beta-chimaerin [Maniola hyperantus]XP_034827623.1 beta-chimaerin [Maniola hyperantus]
MDNLKNIWKPELYRIQMEAPVPKRLICENCPDRPEFYGKEYHGVMGHREAALFLDGEPNGAFLIRKGNECNDFYTLSWRFNDRIHHYKLYYDGTHYIKEKRYDSIYDLVADGLIICHMELKAHHILEMINSRTNYTESPYVTLNRRKLKNTLTEIHQAPKNGSPINRNDNQILEIETDIKKPLDLTPIEDSPLLFKYLKSHNFKVHTFKGLNWCELCANFLWGFTAQGVKCEDCGFIAHSKCSDVVPNHCLPDLKKLRGVFGIDLTTLLNAHSSTLPFVVRKCVNEIEARGMDSEGIYRVSGFADEIEALKLAFDKDGEAADLSVYSNINVIAGTLKLYLRLLPVPLITYEVHPHLVNAIQMKTPSRQVSMLRECLDMLPPAHFNCLQYMVQHLHRVSQQADVNKMSAHNLSTVFAPTLVATPPAISDLAAEIRALQALIEHCPQIYYGNK